MYASPNIRCVSETAYDDIKVQYLSFAEASNALKDGNVDVAFVTAGHPTAAIQDIATQNHVVLLPVDSDKADALIAKYPFYTKLTIAAKMCIRDRPWAHIDIGGTSTAAKTAGFKVKGGTGFGVSTLIKLAQEM